MRPIPQKPWPLDVSLLFLKNTSMSSQWRNFFVISACVSGSASRKPSMVLSENTTPQPKVASGGFRSTTVISQVGLAFFARIEK